MKILDDKFFRRSALQVARDLLGVKLVTSIGNRITSAMIVEAEAYRHGVDEASHSFKGKTKRNEVMFLSGGHCYVYFIYGVHYCVNVVTGREGHGEAVLIRAAKPVGGIEIMKRRRSVDSIYMLTNGPGKLCRAMGIDKKMLREHMLQSDKIWLEPYRSFETNEIGKGPRIGISKATQFQWRYFVKGNPWVSA